MKIVIILSFLIGVEMQKLLEVKSVILFLFEWSERP